MTEHARRVSPFNVVTGHAFFDVALSHTRVFATAATSSECGKARYGMGCGFELRLVDVPAFLMAGDAELRFAVARRTFVLTRLRIDGVREFVVQFMNALDNGFLFVVARGANGSRIGRDVTFSKRLKPDALMAALARGFSVTCLAGNLHRSEARELTVVLLEIGKLVVRRKKIDEVRVAGFTNCGCGVSVVACVTRRHVGHVRIRGIRNFVYTFVARLARKVGGDVLLVREDQLAVRIRECFHAVFVVALRALVGVFHVVATGTRLFLCNEIVLRACRN